MTRRIRLPYQFYPSSLLWVDSLSQAGKDLRARCRQLSACDRTLLQSLADDARELVARGDASGCATALICLADCCLDSGELVLAREYCEQAKAHFCSYEDSRHVHNWAVALYALGLVLHSLGQEKEAANSYDEALRAFRRARAEWLMVRDCAQRRMSQCRGVERWIEKLRASLASASPVPSPRASSLVSLPVFPATSAGDPLCAMEEFEELIEVEESVAGRASFALRVKGDSMLDAGIKDGDLVLIHETTNWPGPGQIVVVRIDEMESGSVLKRFYRLPDHIRLQPANKEYPFLIVLPAWRLKDDIEEYYTKRYPSRPLQFLVESSVQCVGWYICKVP